MENEKKAEIDKELHTYQTIEAKPVYLPDDYYFFKQPLYKRILNKIIMLFVTIFSQLVGRIRFGFKIKGKKNLKNIKGAIIVANHIHPFDAFMLATSFYPRRVFVTMLQTNLGLPGGKVIRLVGGIPIPDRKNLLERFMKEMAYTLEKKHQLITIYPEAALIPYCDHIREFKKGAFKFACMSDVPIIPMVWTFHKPRGLYKLFKKKPTLHLTVLKPYTITKCERKVETVDKALNEVHQIMEDFFNQNNEVSYTPEK